MTLAADARETLQAWLPPDAEQAGLRAEYLAFLARHHDALWRTCRAGHLTASTLVVDPASGRVLLTLHPRVGRWLQLGGHCEPGDEDLRSAAAREAAEESGITGLVLGPGPARLDRHPVTCGGGRLDHLDVQYLATAPPGAPATASAESLDLAWFDWDDLPAETDAAVRALVHLARTR